MVSNIKQAHQYHTCPKTYDHMLHDVGNIKTTYSICKNKTNDWIEIRDMNKINPGLLLSLYHIRHFKHN